MAQARKPPTVGQRLTGNLIRRVQYQEKKKQTDKTVKVVVTVDKLLAFVRNKPLDSSFVGNQNRSGDDRDDAARQRHAKRVYDTIQAQPDPEATKIEFGESLARRLPGYSVTLVDHLSHTEDHPAQPSYAFSVKKTPKKR
ncbi:MAG: hypothetical protein JWO61_361 [Candidatus Saccharibacteria bacterium]|nr:hypothetical protein [Candidatus Saccharibacteria bacterium]